MASKVSAGGALPVRHSQIPPSWPLDQHHKAGEVHQEIGHRIKDGARVTAFVHAENSHENIARMGDG
jgi:hypothetical protein